jgi:hypothetical protein
VKSMIRELASGDAQHLGSPLWSAHTRSHDLQVTCY